MKVKVNIPEYFQVKHYKSLAILSSLDETEQMIHTISSICEIERDEILKWDINSVIEVYGIINNIISNTNQSFYPIIEWNGQLYGYRNMSKMTLGEYIDIDTLCKDSDANLTSILAILYRPLKSNKIKDNKFIIKSTFKAIKYEVENIFDYYEVEDYDSSVRKQRTPEFETFPLEIAMGGLGFFLSTAAMLLANIQIYSLKPQIEILKKKKMTMNKTKLRLLNIMDGFLFSTNLLKHPSYTLQETNQSLN